MFRHNHPMKSPLFDYYAPQGAHFRGLLSIPHSGEYIPPEFNLYLSGNIEAYKSDVDYKVNELVDIAALQEAGIAVMVANVHRVCVDLNRAESNCILFWKENTQGEKLVKLDPDSVSIQRLIESFYLPYYELLKSAIQDLEKKKQGPVSVVDLHSMPSRPTEYHMKQNPNQKESRPDFCLSDRNGKTCSEEFIQSFKKDFISRGVEATLNDPYIGGNVTEFVDQFRTNNIQIEINRSLYMDEKKKTLISEKVIDLKPMLTQILINGFVKFDS